LLKSLLAPRKALFCHVKECTKKYPKNVFNKYVYDTIFMKTLIFYTTE